LNLFGDGNCKGPINFLKILYITSQLTGTQPYVFSLTQSFIKHHVNLISNMVTYFFHYISYDDGMSKYVIGRPINSHRQSLM